MLTQRWRLPQGGARFGASDEGAKQKPLGKLAGAAVIDRHRLAILARAAARPRSGLWWRVAGALVRRESGSDRVLSFAFGATPITWSAKRGSAQAGKLSWGYLNHDGLVAGNSDIGIAFMYHEACVKESFV